MYRHGQEEIDAVTEVLKSGQWFRYGEASAGHTLQAEKFEKEWAAHIGTKHACFTTSGTASLMSCLAAMGVGPGDEVIIPGYTWMASALAPLAVGAIPIIVDVDESLMIDPAAVAAAITPRTKVINPVHMNGLACDMDAIMAIARERRLLVLEDACQSDGGVWTGGKKLGGIGDMGAFSFNFYKVISCGDGGAFVTNRREFFERGIIYSDGGCIFRPLAKEILAEFFAGMNFRGNEILAAIMRVQLSRLPGILADLHRIRARILDALRDAPGLTPIPYNGGESTGTGATIGFSFEDEPAAREFIANMKSNGYGGSVPIDSGRHVYANWEPVLEKRGAFSKAANPFRHPANLDTTYDYSAEMLPRTLALLRRTVLIGIDPDWSEEKIAGVIVAIKRSARTSDQNHPHPNPLPEYRAREVAK